MSSDWWMIMRALYPLLYLVAVVLIAQWPARVSAKAYFLGAFFLELLISISYPILFYLQKSLGSINVANYYTYLSIGSLVSLALLVTGIASLKNDLQHPEEPFAGSGSFHSDLPHQEEQ